MEFEEFKKLTPQERDALEQVEKTPDEQVVFEELKKQLEGDMNNEVEQFKNEDQKLDQIVASVNLNNPETVEQIKQELKVDETLEWLNKEAKILSQIKENTQEQIFEWEPLENFSFDENGFFRVINEEGYQDYLKEGVLRASPEGTPSQIHNGFDLGGRTTGFPSFAKGTPDLGYAKEGENNYIFESNVTLFGRGDKNPKTEKVITSFRHWAYRPIDPETGYVIKAMTPDMIKNIYKLDKESKLYRRK